MRVNRLKKILAVSLCLSMMATTCIFASDGKEIVNVNLVDTNIEVQRALAGISDVDVSTIPDGAINAVLIDENGNETEVETFVTIREVSKTRSSGTLYALTAVADTRSSKETDGSQQASNTRIEVTATGTLYWIDNFGSDNQVRGAAGGWNTYNGSKVSSMKAQCSAGRFNPDSESWSVGNPFDVTCKEELIGEIVKLMTTATATSKDGTSKETLVLTVQGTTFD